MKFFVWFTFCCFTLGSATLQADDDDAPEKATPSKQIRTGIFVDAATQVASGLKTMLLQRLTYRTERRSYGMAISIEPLLSLQNQYLNAQAQQSSATAKARVSESQLNRLTYLHNEQIIATRTLQDQQAVLQMDKAALAGSHYLGQQIINTTRLVWGQTLTDWLIKNDSQLTALVQQRTILLKITVPAEINTRSGALKTIFVAASGHRDQAVVAALVSAVPQTDSFTSGQQYFYQLPSQDIKAGMRVNVWLPSAEQAQTGVNIPESAVCWHLGQAVVFVKVAPQQFIHKPLAAYSKTATGYFVSAGLKPGDEIVSRGAQMLLSQELKGQIPDEDDE